jgi:hypothetical protein
MEAQDRGAWPEDFGASTATSRMRDVARRRREAEEKLAQHLFAMEPQLRSTDPPDETVAVLPVLVDPMTPVHALEPHIPEPQAPAASEGPKAPS